MESFLALLDRYPGAWTVLGPVIAWLAWSVVSTIFNTVYDSRSPHSDPEWAAFFVRHPRWGAVVSAFKTGGVNLPGLLRSARVFFGGSLPAPVAVAFRQSRPPTAIEARQAAIDAAKLILQEESAKAVEQLAPVVIVPAATAVPVDEETPKP